MNTECEHSNCSARAMHEIHVHNQDFSFCGHHARKVLKALHPEVSEKALAKIWRKHR